VRRIIGSALKPGARVLDIGTGPGAIPLRLQRLYPETFFAGCDISGDMLGLARARSMKKKIPLGLFAGDAQQLPCADKSVDAVMCLFALHHLDAPERFLREIDRVLKPGGTLLVLDFRRDLPPRLFRILNALWQAFFFFSAGRFGFRDSARSAWRPAEIRDAVERCGLNRFRVHANRLELMVMNKSS